MLIRENEEFLYRGSKLENLIRETTSLNNPIIVQ